MRRRRAKAAARSKAVNGSRKSRPPDPAGQSSDGARDAEDSTPPAAAAAAKPGQEPSLATPSRSPSPTAPPPPNGVAHENDTQDDFQDDSSQGKEVVVENGQPAEPEQNCHGMKRHINGSCPQAIPPNKKPRLEDVELDLLRLADSLALAAEGGEAAAVNGGTGEYPPSPDDGAKRAPSPIVTNPLLFLSEAASAQQGYCKATACSERKPENCDCKGPDCPDLTAAAESGNDCERSPEAGGSCATPEPSGAAPGPSAQASLGNGGVGNSAASGGSVPAERCSSPALALAGGKNKKGANAHLSGFFQSFLDFALQQQMSPEQATAVKALAELSNGTGAQLAGAAPKQSAGKGRAGKAAKAAAAKAAAAAAAASLSQASNGVGTSRQTLAELWPGPLQQNQEAAAAAKHKQHLQAQASAQYSQKAAQHGAAAQNHQQQQSQALAPMQGQPPQGQSLLQQKILNDAHIAPLLVQPNHSLMNHQQELHSQLHSQHLAQEQQLTQHQQQAQQHQQFLQSHELAQQYSHHQHNQLLLQQQQQLLLQDAQSQQCKWQQSAALDAQSQGHTNAHGQVSDGAASVAKEDDAPVPRNNLHQPAVASYHGQPLSMGAEGDSEQSSRPYSELSEEVLRGDASKQRCSEQATTSNQCSTRSVIMNHVASVCFDADKGKSHRTFMGLDAERSGTLQGAITSRRNSSDPAEEHGLLQSHLLPQGGQHVMHARPQHGERDAKNSAAASERYGQHGQHCEGSQDPQGSLSLLAHASDARQYYGSKKQMHFQQPMPQQMQPYKHSEVEQKSLERLLQQHMQSGDEGLFQKVLGSEQQQQQRLQQMQSKEHPAQGHRDKAALKGQHNSSYKSGLSRSNSIGFQQASGPGEQQDKRGSSMKTSQPDNGVICFSSRGASGHDLGHRVIRSGSPMSSRKEQQSSVHDPNNDDLKEIIRQLEIKIAEDPESSDHLSQRQQHQQQQRMDVSHPQSSRPGSVRASADLPANQTPTPHNMRLKTEPTPAEMCHRASNDLGTHGSTRTSFSSPSPSSLPPSSSVPSSSTVKAHLAAYLQRQSLQVKVESSGPITVLSTLAASVGMDGEEDKGATLSGNSTPAKQPPSILSSFLESPLKYLDTPTKNILDTPTKKGQLDFPPCSCVDQIIEKDEGPYYTHLGAGPTVAAVRHLMETRFGEKGKAVRIEKVVYTGKEGKSSQGCPIAKWVLRRASEEEKLLCIVRERAGHRCENAVIVMAIMAWEGVNRGLADLLYNELTSTLNNYGVPTCRRCSLNEDRTCACQGLDTETCGASFSFGCSWSMYYNGCKFARSKYPRKFKLNGDDSSKEEEKLESYLQELATHVGPVYKQLAPDAYTNQVEHEVSAPDCRLGLQDGRPFSGVTACVDFCAHAHRDQHNMPNGSTVVCTLTKEDNRAIGVVPEDEQLHVLPLYKLAELDEHGDPHSLDKRIRTGAIQVLRSFPREVRMLAEPAKSGRRKKAEAKRAAAEKQQAAAAAAAAAAATASPVQPHGLPSAAGGDARAEKSQVTPGRGSKHGGGMADAQSFTSPQHHSQIQQQLQLAALSGNGPQQLAAVTPPLYHAAVDPLGQYAALRYGAHTPVPSPHSALASPHYQGTPATPPYPHAGLYPSPQPDPALPPYHPSYHHAHHQAQLMGARPTLPPIHTLMHQHYPYPAAASAPSPGYHGYQGATFYGASPFAVSPHYAEDPTRAAMGGYDLGDERAQAYLAAAAAAAYHPSVSPWAGQLASSPHAHHSHHPHGGGYHLQQTQGTTTELPPPPPHVASSPLKVGRDEATPTKRVNGVIKGLGVAEGCHQKMGDGAHAAQGAASQVGAAHQDDQEEVWSDSEHNFLDREIGGVAIAPAHGSVLIECAKRELHATTPLRKPNRRHPTRISLVFYQHKSLNVPRHGLALWEAKMADKKAKREAAEMAELESANHPAAEGGGGGGGGGDVPAAPSTETPVSRAPSPSSLSSSSAVAAKRVKVTEVKENVLDFLDLPPISYAIKEGIPTLRALSHATCSVTTAHSKPCTHLSGNYSHFV
ncbi:uncharacterized protein LOC144946458 [Lampetra fluviatilis]